MRYKKILITGGCGFVGSSLALRFKRLLPKSHIIACDNFFRRGSKLNIPRLEAADIEVIRGDVRRRKTFDQFYDVDLIIDCAAEPSSLAGKNSSPLYALETNIFGTIQCLELARRTGAHTLFLSTSRVYPIHELNSIEVVETKTRFELASRQRLPGVSSRGISEAFPLGTQRTLYGASKLASEMIISEYELLYDTRAIINRCGAIAGPWQFGKIDQGIAALWMARHFFANQGIIYIGFGGTGKQVRDFLHPDDLFLALKYQLEHFKMFSGQICNLGGGPKTSASLVELTEICERITGNSKPTFTKEFI